jgi:hypothetical protein
VTTLSLIPYTGLAVKQVRGVIGWAQAPPALCFTNFTAAFLHNNYEGFHAAFSESAIDRPAHCFARNSAGDWQCQSAGFFPMRASD